MKKFSISSLVKRAHNYKKIQNTFILLYFYLWRKSTVHGHIIFLWFYQSCQPRQSCNDTEPSGRICNLNLSVLFFNYLRRKRGIYWDSMLFLCEQATWSLLNPSVFSFLTCYFHFCTETGMFYSLVTCASKRAWYRFCELKLLQST